LSVPFFRCLSSSPWWKALLLA
jgi:hypothetical protein